MSKVKLVCLSQHKRIYEVPVEWLKNLEGDPEMFVPVEWALDAHSMDELEEKFVVDEEWVGEIVLYADEISGQQQYSTEEV